MITSKEKDRLLNLINKWRRLARQYKRHALLYKQSSIYSAKKATMLEKELHKGLLEKFFDYISKKFNTFLKF